MRRRCHVSAAGKVQDVGLRVQSLHKAREFGLGGWVRNEPDGTVSIEVEGEAIQVAEFLLWLRHNPGSVRTTSLNVQDIEPTSGHRFTMLN